MCPPSAQAGRCRSPARVHLRVRNCNMAGDDGGVRMMAALYKRGRAAADACTPVHAACAAPPPAGAHAPVDAPAGAPAHAPEDDTSLHGWPTYASLLGSSQGALCDVSPPSVPLSRAFLSAFLSSAPPTAGGTAPSTGAPSTSASSTSSSALSGADADRSATRQRQIDLGKNTLGYARYRAQVPLDSRGVRDPQTPNPYASDISKRHWDSMVRTWRRALHQYDFSLPGTAASGDGGSGGGEAPLPVETRPDGRVAILDASRDARAFMQQQLWGACDPARVGEQRLLLASSIADASSSGAPRPPHTPTV
ncbi:hypothetical protein EON68_03330 [archaeon]|nr:MAG: hypothetical protein EON68_03330 [archaeon]